MPSDQHPGGGGYLDTKRRGVHAYDSFSEPALEKNSQNDTRH